MAMSEKVREALDHIMNDKEWIAASNERWLKDKAQKELQQTEFFNSALCRRLARDLIEKKKGLNSEDFLYFSEKIKDELDWSMIRDEEVELFIDTLTARHLPVDKPSTEDTETETHYFRLGLHIITLYGQGAITLIRAV